LRSSAPAAANRLSRAVHQSKAISRQGILERVFTLAFRGLVYPQIWEDPEVDLRALALSPTSRLITITSGGCNVLSYLTAAPGEIVAVDLNRAHVALTRLKLAAARHLPDYDTFFRFFGDAEDEANVTAYERHLHGRLDAQTRRHWDGRDFLGRRRISLFARGLYRRGLLGRFIGVGHLLARLYGADPRDMVGARSIAEQKNLFDTLLAPLFDKRFVRWLTSQRASLFGLGIPPAQYEALAAGAGMAGVLRERLERLACGFPMSENYFAWQAFARCYPAEGPLPPYLTRANFAAIRERVGSVRVEQRSVTEELAASPPASFDGYVLLDAQDWMTDTQLTALWSEITRTARPGARVIFRTAGVPTILPGRVPDEILARWSYASERSRELAAEDRSSAYGGFHLYEFRSSPAQPGSEITEGVGG
jgi:S-adenosylmethionine-diacylglycerol 3-amino-3-carboxypropyl transferase